ncbi:MAG: nuclear transport factor 2 family protein [Gammaproteobacteria bacterium]|nr:nuclear transport factor 2 family protein [Gammaproteobacteria bacterium]
MNNVQIVQQGYVDFSQGNIEGILNVMSDDVVWIDPGYPDIPYAGNLKGRVQVGEFFKKMDAAAVYTKFEPRSYIAQGDQVVALGFFAGYSKATQKTFESDWAMVWTFKNGKVMHLEIFVDTNTIAKAYR